MNLEKIVIIAALVLIAYVILRELVKREVKDYILGLIKAKPALPSGEEPPNPRFQVN